jgi:hypothetical protein
MTANMLGIDVESPNAKAIIRLLKRLKTTVDVVHGGAYRQDAFYSQIHLTTSWTEKQLDDWLYRSKGTRGYIGCYERNQVAA